MEDGARGMEAGAREMDETAEKLRSPQFRAEQIARAARRGETVTDAQLIAAIPKLHEGAEKLRQAPSRCAPAPSGCAAAADGFPGILRSS